jgi:hypothetical protein
MNLVILGVIFATMAIAAAIGVWFAASTKSFGESPLDGAGNVIEHRYLPQARPGSARFEQYFAQTRIVEILPFWAEIAAILNARAGILPLQTRLRPILCGRRV